MAILLLSPPDWAPKPMWATASLNNKEDMVQIATTDKKKTIARKTALPAVNSLWVVFDLPLNHGQTGEFREAVLHCISSHADQLVAGNKQTDADGNMVYSSAHPLLQFRCHRHRAAVFALGRAVPVVERFLEQYCQGPGKGRLFPWRGRSLSLGMPLVREKEHGFAVRLVNPKLLLQPLVYRLHTWLPLNRENYEQWWKPNRNLADTEKTKKLEALLTGHLCAFVESQGGFIPRKKIKLTILDKDRLKKVFFKEEGLVAYDIRYTVNLHLPPYIGLGNHPAFGYGWQRPEKE